MATGPVLRDTLRSAPVGTARSRPSQISRVPYLPGLDGMRALAVVAVMIYHANVDWLPGGFLGVEVFFVISGYLITLLLVAERERNGRVDLRHFWIRRAKRLLPALFVMLFIVVTYTALFRSDALGQIRGDVVASLFYGINWYQIWVGAGYTAAGDFAPLRHLWSLAVEEQFYLVWPLVMAVLLRAGPRKVTAVAKWLLLAAVLVTVFVALAYHPGRIATCADTPEAFWTVGERCISKADALYLSTITRSSGLLLGAAFALLWRPAAIMRSPMRSKGPLVDLLALVGLAGLAAMTWYVNFVTPDGADPLLFRGGFFVAGLFTLLLIAAVTHQGAYSGKLLGNPVFLWVGTRSYGLYLYHWPIYQMIRQVAGNPLTFNQFAMAMVATVIVTEASYRFVETPIRTGHLAIWWRDLRRSRDPLPRQVVLGGAAVTIALALFSSVSLATAPLEQNEIARSTEEGREFTTDIRDFVGGGGVGGGDDDAAAADDGATPPPATSPNGAIPPDPLVPDGSEQPVAPTTTTTTTTTTTLPPEPIRYLAIGDSVMLGAAQRLESAGVVVDAEVSRQLVDMIPPMQQLQERSLFGDAVIVHLGTNGPVGEESLNQFMNTLSDVQYVLVLTVRANRSWTARNNELLRSLSQPGPNYRNNVIVVDWEQRSNECSGDCFASDGIHLRPEGVRFYSQLVFDVLGLTPS
jgi:peptidoglycan/LPS O-acetylase OafA/YrhL